MVQFPLSSLVGAEAVVLFREELLLCNLRPTEKALIVSDASTNPHYVAACFGAALEIGAEIAQVVVPFVEGTPEMAARRRAEKLVPYEHIIDLMQRMDFVVDLTSIGFLHSERQVEMLSHGTRMLRVREPIEVLQRLFPTQEIKARVEGGARVLAASRRLRVTTPAGTDLSVDRGDRPVFMQYGFADLPGRWDHWPTAQVVQAPAEDTARGTLVLTPGDFIGHRYVSSPVRLTVEHGRITRMDGEGSTSCSCGIISPAVRRRIFGPRRRPRRRPEVLRRQGRGATRTGSRTSGGDAIIAPGTTRSTATRTITRGARRSAASTAR